MPHTTETALTPAPFQAGLAPEEKLLEQQETSLKQTGLIGPIQEPTEEESFPVVGVSSDVARQTVEDDEVELTRIERERDGIIEKRDAISAAAVPEVDTEQVRIEARREVQLEAGGITREEAEDAGIDISKGFQLDTSTGLFIPLAGVAEIKGEEEKERIEKAREGGRVAFGTLAEAEAALDSQSKEIIDNNRELDTREAEIREEIDALESGTDAAFAAQIEAFKKKTAANVALLKDSNKRLLESRRSNLIRQGVSRFTPSTADDILGEEQSLGLIRISQLEAESAALIASARLAFNTQKFDRLNSALQDIEKKKEERQKEIDKLNKGAIKRAEELNEIQRGIIREDKVLQAQDIVGDNVQDIFNLINIDEDGNLVENPVDIETIRGVLDNVSTAKLKSGNAQIVKLEDGRTVLIDKDKGEILKDFGGQKVDNTGGNRDDLSSLQILEGRTLSIDIFGKRAGAKPENYGLIEDLMARGMTPDEISDNLRFSGQSEKFSGSFKEGFEFLTKTGFTTADRINSLEGLDTLLSEDNISAAREFMLGLARDKADAETRKKVDGRDDLLTALDSIEMGLKELKDQGQDTGIFTGIGQKGLELIGTTAVFATPELNEIANEIALAIIGYRQAVSGAAFTESEAEAYDKVFPSTGKTTALNQSKINSIRKVADNAQNAFYRRSIGSSYDSIIGVTPQEPEITEIKRPEDVPIGGVFELEDGTRVKRLSENEFEEI